MSPIKGISDRVRLPRLGKIHLEIKPTSPKGVDYPKAVDYFVCPPDVVAIYGETPKALDVVFPVDDDLINAQWYKAYSSTRGLVCKGDGETANRLIDPTTRVAEETGVITGPMAAANAKDVEWVEGITCPGPDCEYYQAKQCRPVMNLQFLLPKIPGLGIWQLDTSSYNSILNINSTLRLLRATFGTAAGIPLVLRLVPQEVQVDGKKLTVHVLTLGSQETWAKLARTKTDPISALLAAPDEGRPELLYSSEEAQQAWTEIEKTPQPPKDVPKSARQLVYESFEPPPTPPPVVQPKTKPATITTQPGDISIDEFRGEVRKLGYKTGATLFNDLGIESIQAWTQSGRTLKEALAKLKQVQQSGQKKPPTPLPDPVLDI